MSWVYEPLSSHYDVHNGLSKTSKYFGSGFPFLAFKDVFHNAFLPEKLDGKVETTERERESYSIKRGDVFVTRTSETYDELGMSSVALKDYPNATYNGFTKRLRPKTDSLLPRFVGYYMRSPEFRANFLQFSQMTTRASLKNENLLAIRIPVPPKETQKRISDILSAYDSLIENNQKQIKLLEEAAQRLYRKWFIDLHFPEHETTPVDLETGLPEGWKRMPIAEVFTNITIGKTPSRKRKDCFSNVGIPWYSVADLGSEGLYALEPSEYLTPSAVEEFRVKVAPPKTILLSFKLTIGRVSIVEEQSASNEAIAHLISEDEELQNYGYWYLCEFPYETLGSTSSISTAINSKMVRKIPFLLPDIKLLSQFNKMVMPLMQQILSLRKGCIAAREALNRLLKKAFENGVDVKE